MKNIEQIHTNYLTQGDEQQEYPVHRISGFRSTVTSSIFKNRFIKNIVNVIGIFDVIKHSVVVVEDPCPSVVV